MKIVSLLPSATEIVFALGLGDQLEGVSFECDFPEAARRVAVVSGTALDVDRPRSAAEIDAEVSTMMAAGESIYSLDDARIRAIDPDVILAQDLCAVCAVPSGQVQDALGVIGCHADVVSLDPAGLDDVIECVAQVGRATGTEQLAAQLTAALRRRVADVRARVAGRPRPRVFVLEWADPPFNGGHWVPEMVEAAGGEPVLAAVRTPSRRLTWDEIAAESIDVTVFSPCGFGLAGAVDQAASFIDLPDLPDLGRIVAVDANAYFSRPGPRVVDGVELLGELLHPTRPGAPVPGAQILR
jgi:iron complex transport system substrate-binding protein